MSPTPIRGWKALERFTGLKEHQLRYLIGYHDFPRAERIITRVRTRLREAVVSSLWDGNAVTEWLKTKRGKHVIRNKFKTNRRSPVVADQDEGTVPDGATATSGRRPVHQGDDHGGSKLAAPTEVRPAISLLGVHEVCPVWPAP